MGGPCLTDEEKRLARQSYARDGNLSRAARAAGRSVFVVTAYLISIGMHVRRPD